MSTGSALIRRLLAAVLLAAIFVTANKALAQSIAVTDAEFRYQRLSAIQFVAEDYEPPSTERRIGFERNLQAARMLTCAAWPA